MQSGPLPEGFRLPAEYEPQSAVWLTWPANPDTWPRRRAEAETAHARLTAAISRLQPVHLICAAAAQPAARRALEAAKADPAAIHFHDWPANDAWCRDHGPLFLRGPGGDRCIADLPYNAWGGKFEPWDDDDAVAGRVAALRGLPRIRLPIYGEGGALEINRDGHLITTESVWLNPNRNPGLTRAEAERIFSTYLGVTRTTWLREGLIGDDTDGHIDTISRFVDDRTVVTVLPGPADPNYPVLRENLERLQEHFTVIPLPHPAPMHLPGREVETLPATYANFLILNQAVLVPEYGQPETDTAAQDRLRDLFPGREVLGVDCAVLIQEGGAVHCLTMQEPAAQ